MPLILYFTNLLIIFFFSGKVSIALPIRPYVASYVPDRNGPGKRLSKKFAAPTGGRIAPPPNRSRVPTATARRVPHLVARGIVAKPDSDLDRVDLLRPRGRGVPVPVPIRNRRQLRQMRRTTDPRRPPRPAPRIRCQTRSPTDAKSNARSTAVDDDSLGPASSPPPPPSSSSEVNMLRHVAVLTPSLILARFVTGLPSFARRQIWNSTVSSRLRSLSSRCRRPRCSRLPANCPASDTRDSAIRSRRLADRSRPSLRPFRLLPQRRLSITKPAGRGDDDGGAPPSGIATGRPAPGGPA